MGIAEETIQEVPQGKKEPENEEQFAPEYPSQPQTRQSNLRIGEDTVVNRCSRCGAIQVSLLKYFL